jgi:hypothetical protein
MDGKPLRYFPTEDGHFCLYSVGLDCADDGGKMPSALNLRNAALQRVRGGNVSPRGDLVWPAPASAEAARAYYAEKASIARRQREQAEREQAQQEAEEEVLRQLAVKTLLSNPNYKRTTWAGMGEGAKEPVYQDQPITKYFHNEAADGRSQISLDELLTLKPVITGGEPEVVTFELPIKYELVTNYIGGRIALAADSAPDDEYPSQELQGCERATNGDCLLYWNAAAEGPGPHALQALLTVEMGRGKAPINLKGPVMPYLSTNLCQFFSESTLFSDAGANLCARLPEAKGEYKIEIKTPAGKHVKTLTGSTTNGLINVEWDLTDENGQKYAKNSFESFFTVKLADSGRSQTMKQGQTKIGTRGD